MSIVVGGGTGFIGRAFAKLAKSKGYKVLSVSRKPGTNKMTWLDVCCKGLPADTVAVVSMSGEQVLKPFQRWTDNVKRELIDSRVEKTNILTRAIQNAAKPPKAFLCFSGIAYYKPDVSMEYTEDVVVPAYDFLSQLSKDWEAAATLPANSKTRVSILRTGVVLGNGGGVVDNLWIPFFLGTGGPMGQGDQWMSWIHVDDVAGIMWHAIENDSVQGVINCTAPNPVPSKEFTKTLAKAMNRPHCLPFPKFAANLMFGKEASKILLEGQKVLPDRTIKSGYKFLYPDIESACKQIVTSKRY